MRTTAVAASALERAILQILLYSDLFDYPLTPEEAAHYFIGVPSTADEVRACLVRTRCLADHAVELDGYLARRGSEALIARRLDRAAASDRLWWRALRFIVTAAQHVLNLFVPRLSTHW